MSTDETIKKSHEAFDRFLKSPEFDLWVQKQKDEERILSKRHRRFTFYLKKHSFSDLMSRLISEHDDAYQDKCYKKGYEPYPNCKLSFVLGYVKSKGKYIEHKKGITDGMFSEELYYFKGYYFLTVCGQGCFSRIYDRKVNVLVQV